MIMTIERRLKMISILDKMERHSTITKAMNVTDASEFKKEKVTNIKNDNKSQEGRGYEQEK